MTEAEIDGALLRALNAREECEGVTPGVLVPILDGLLKARLSEGELTASIGRLSDRGLISSADGIALLPAGRFPDESGGAEVCCDDMKRQLVFECSDHETRHECPDVLVTYDPVTNEYKIPVRDGGTSGVLIEYCPWCGQRLPDSCRERWFSEVEALEIDPTSPALPAAYRTAEWRLRRAKEWVVWRQDDNGITAVVSRFQNEQSALQEAARLESLGHKQTYWVAVAG